MPAEQPKAQHFVHRAYLEGFQDPTLLKQRKRALWLYMPGKTPIPQASERLAKRSYYYCHREQEKRVFHAEDVLQKLEDAAQPILNRLRNGELRISLQDRLTFAGYVALSHTRVPAFERFVNYHAALDTALQLEQITNNRQALERVVAEIEKEEGRKIDVDEYYMKLTGGSVYTEQTNRGWSLGQMFETMKRLQVDVYRMCWTFLIAPDDGEGFLTSDNPVSFFHPAEGIEKHIGAAVLATPHFTFPIGRRICLLAQPYRNPRKVNLTEREVRQVNRGTITRADSQIYAPFKSQGVQELFTRMHQQAVRPSRVLLDHGRVVVK